jgi:hypothetical protein
MPNIPSSSNNGASTIVPVVIVAVAVSAILFLLWFLLGNRLLQQKQPQPGPGSNPQVGDVIKSPSASGIVSALGANSVTFETVGVVAESGIIYDASTRTAHISGATEIALLTQRSPESMRRAMEQYAKDIKKQTPENPIPTPETHSREIIQLSDIRVGDAIIVTSVDGADINTATEFNVSSIVVTRSE